jgi:D-alanyl-lipoteichoic acid acyltransferase DltB (MBOAT superfamily)
MPEQMIDIVSGEFWLTFVLALLILTPIRSGRLRQWLWALVNVVFLRLVLYQDQWLAVVAALIVFYFLLQFACRHFGKVMVVLGLGVPTLGLFLVHKFPVLSSRWEATSLHLVLTAVGFSYVALRIVDLLRAVLEGRHQPPNLPSTINYLIPFHMLAAGPIQNYDEFVAQPSVPEPLTVLQTLRATERLAWGLFKKFVLAYALQRVFLTGFMVPGWRFFLEIQLFYIWLYLDFSGLSDLAVGIGSLLGLATPENFDRPYLARNMINFWERWHISLSQFIRRNLYIPIQLWLVRRTEGRHSLWCSAVAFTVAFGLCGLWHAGTVRFLLWGLWHAAGLVITSTFRYYLARRLGAEGLKRYMEDRRIRVLSTALTFEFVAFSLVIIQAPIARFWP